MRAGMQINHRTDVEEMAGLAPAARAAERMKHALRPPTRP